MSMGLFSRKRTAASAASDSPASPASPASADSPASPAEAEGTSVARPEHLEDGPFDIADAPEEDRIDLGGLQVPRLDGFELRMEVDQRTRAVIGSNLVKDGSSLQVQAFAAPRSKGLWDTVRSSLRDSVVSQGGTAETRTCPFGTELIARLPVKRADGRTGYRPVRFLGVDGPRWFVRAVLSGPALSRKDAAQEFESVLSRVVVVRGGEAMAPQELIPLHLPGQRPGGGKPEDDPLAILARGPEITEIG
jgi:hypothetical protein